MKSKLLSSDNRYKNNINQNQNQIEFRILKNSPKKFRIPEQNNELNNISLNLKNVSLDGLRKKDKVIMMKKEEFVKNYNKLLKGNIFGIAN